MVTLILCLTWGGNVSPAHLAGDSSKIVYEEETVV